MDALWPHIGEEVTFRGAVYLPLTEPDQFAAIRTGVFLGWHDSGGDTIAFVQTEHGATTVRWSMIDGIQSPVGLLDR